MPRPILIVVVGPTASGKTAFSISLATHFKTEIVSADSRQMYREMEIGTAKPSPEELMIAPHHFINSLSIFDDYSAGKYETEALSCIHRLFLKHDKVILTGGSSLFVNAVCNGLDRLPQADPTLRKKYEELLQKEGIKALQEQLERKDAVYYSEVDIQNPRRLIRALEVIELTGLPYSALRSKEGKKRDFEVIKIGLKTEKEQLIKWINTRIEKMLAAGWLEECRALYPYRHLNALQTVGYKEIFDYIDGKCDWNITIERIRTETWHYAKRQLTWLKKEKDIKWFSPEEISNAIQFILKYQA